MTLFCKRGKREQQEIHFIRIKSLYDSAFLQLDEQNMEEYSMDLFHWNAKKDVNQWMTEALQKTDAVVLDVRTEEEYLEGHIPGSVLLPLSELDTARQVIPGEQTPLYVYCRSGVRSKQAASKLRQMGYRQVTDMGGINRWKGAVE